MNNVTTEQIRQARVTNLYEFLLRVHPRDVLREGDSLRLCNNHSVSVKQGYAGYMDFATNLTGNSIEFLVNFLDYDFVDAVRALLNCSSGVSVTHEQSSMADTTSAETTVSKVFSLPPAVQGQYRQLFAYLHQIRKIPVPIIQKIIDEQIAYQEATHNNIIFVPPSRDFGEVKGSNSFQSFRGVLPCSNPMGFWWIKTGNLHSHTDEVFICESAIDALSLYALHEYDYAYRLARKEPAMRIPRLYVSIAGVGNIQKCIAIRQQKERVFLCFDRDNAGDTAIQKLDEWGSTEFYKKHPGNGYRYTSPFLTYRPASSNCKDWNDELRNCIDYYTNQNLQLNIIV